MLEQEDITASANTHVRNFFVLFNGLFVDFQSKHL